MNNEIYKEIPGFEGKPIRLNIEFSQLENNAPVVIIAHGFKAYKDWSLIPVLANEFAYHGFHVIRFSNSHCGVVDKSGSFVETDKFANNSLEKELYDFNKVIESTVHSEIDEEFLRNKRKVSQINLVGHSRGSANALIVANEIFDKIKINSVVCFSPIAHFKHYTDEQFKEWLDKGFIEIHEPNSDTNLRMNRIYYDDIIENSDRYDLKITVEDLVNKKCPVLLIRGDDDKFITQEEAELLVRWSNSNIELEIVTGSSEIKADHNFGMPAKANELNIAMNWAFKIALRFIKMNSL